MITSSQVRLDQLATTMESGFACGKSKLVTQGLLHLRPFNIGRNGEIDLTQEYRVPSEAAPRSKAGLHAGDILFNNTNSPELVGKTAVVRENLNAGFSNHVTLIRIDPARCDPMFVAAYLRRLWMQGHFRAHCTQWVSQAAFGTRLLARLPVSLPPLEEQRRIVGILNRAAKIERLRARAQERLAEFIPALFVKMFGDPVENPMEWEVSPLGDVCISTQYGTSRKANNYAEGVPVLRMGNVTYDGNLDCAELKYVLLSDIDIAKHALCAGDILFNRTNSKELVGKTGMWDGRFAAVAASYFIRLRLDKARACPSYVWAFMNSSAMKRRLFDNARGAIGQANINAREIKSLPLPIPPLSLQRRYDQAVAATRATAAISEAGSQSASALNDSLMSLLLEASA